MIAVINRSEDWVTITTIITTVRCVCKDKHEIDKRGKKRLMYTTYPISEPLSTRNFTTSIWPPRTAIPGNHVCVHTIN